MAKASENKYGHRDKRECSVCGNRIRLKDGRAMFIHHVTRGSLTACGQPCTYEEAIRSAATPVTLPGT